MNQTENAAYGMDWRSRCARGRLAATVPRRPFYGAFVLAGSATTRAERS